MIRQTSTHSFTYRGFIIVKLPGKSLYPITRYHVIKEDNSFGKFDAMFQAVNYIDRLYRDNCG